MSDSSGDDLEELLEQELNASRESSDPESRSPPPKRHHTGTTRQHNGPPSAQATPPSPVCPPHPGYLAGLCIRCGELRPEGDREESVALRYIHDGLELTAREAARARDRAVSHVLARRRLILVLDLDHTLLNSTRFIDLNQQEIARLEEELARQPADRPSLLKLPALQTWTRMRPGVRAFLDAAHERYEMHVYTMGDRAYARAMAAALDPDGRLFSGRVISAGDSTQRFVKDLDVVLGGPAQVLILDDTAAVWPRHGGNLLPINRYIYFRACAERFAAPGSSWLERDSDEDASDGPFTSILGVLDSVHNAYFAAQDDGKEADVRPLVAAQRAKLLAGTTLLLSRIVPLGSRQPEAHPLWQLAAACGAACTLEPGSDVTHVVAPDWTQKVQWAAEHGIPAVTPAWVVNTAGGWKRAREAEFPVPKPGDESGNGGGAASAKPPGPNPAPALDPEEERRRAVSAAGGGQGHAAGT